MKIYSGDPGPPARAYVKSGKGKPKLLHMLNGLDPTWGEKALFPGSSALGYSILKDALGDATRATRLLSRFRHRAILALTPGQPWALTLESVLATIADIENVERQTVQTRRMVAQEPPPVAPGGLGQDMGWTKNPTITPNLPEKK